MSNFYLDAYRKRLLQECLDWPRETPEHVIAVMTLNTYVNTSGPFAVDNKVVFGPFYPIEDDLQDIGWEPLSKNPDALQQARADWAEWCSLNT